MSDLNQLAEVQLPKNQRFGLDKPLTLNSLVDSPVNQNTEEKIKAIHETINNPVDRTIAIMMLPSGK